MNHTDAHFSKFCLLFEILDQFNIKTSIIPNTIKAAFLELKVENTLNFAKVYF